jgi:hypothetical protein
MGWPRLMPALALAWTMALSASGQGTLIYQRYSTANPDPNFPWDFEGQRVLSLYPASMTIDLNQDGVADYLIGTGGGQSTSGFYIYGLQQANKVWGHQIVVSQYAVALASGDFIGADGSSVYDWFEPQVLNGQTYGPAFTVEVDIFTIGYFTGVPSAYCGLQMQVGGQTHYGWVRVGSPIGLNGGWVYDSVFNSTPGASLLAGDGRVPEPSPLALSTMAGIALLVFRRR